MQRNTSTGTDTSFIPEIVGHHEIRKNLKVLVEKDSLSHTLLFSGPSSIGKSLVALECFATLLCKSNSESVSIYGGCKTCQECRLSYSGNHPDLSLFDCRNTKGNISLLREALFPMSLKSHSGKGRFLILDNADELPPIASNLLLKTLEEPPEKAYFSLIAENPSKLPKTLLSRAQIWMLNPLSPDEVLSILKMRDELSPNALKFLQREGSYLLGEGSLESIRILAEKTTEWQTLKRRLIGIAGGDKYEALELAKDLAKDREELKLTFRAIRAIAYYYMHNGHAHNRKLWAQFIINLAYAETLIFIRNVRVEYVLQCLFLELIEPKEPSVLKEALL